MFPAGVHKVAGPFTCITIFSFEGSNGRIHGKVLVGWFGPGKCRNIEMGGDGGVLEL